MEPSVWIVLSAAFLTAVMTGAGVIPFAFAQDVGRRWLGYANAAAAGLMLAASYALVTEGNALSVERTLVGLLIGIAAILISDRLLRRRSTIDVAELSGADARKALLILGVMTAHSFAEGVGVGVSFSGTESLAIFITTAIAFHNIPEGLAIALVLVPRGTRVWKAGLWSIFTSLPQPLMAVPAFLFVQWFQPLLPVGLGLAAGAMIWMVFAELIPDAIEQITASSVANGVALAFAAMMAFQFLVLT